MLKQTDICERRACLLVELSRTVLHYVPKVQPENEQLQARMIELQLSARALAIGAFMPCFGETVLTSITNAFSASTRLAGLAVKRRKKRCGVAGEREQLALPRRPNEVWSMDFISDELANGKRIKVLTIVDDFTKESIDLVTEHGISGQYVVRVLERAAHFRGPPLAIRTDQGPSSPARRCLWSRDYLLGNGSGKVFLTHDSRMVPSFLRLSI
jgi:putative transposase